MDGGHFVILSSDGTERKVSKNTVETIVIFGNVSVTTPAIKKCLELGIDVSFLSNQGKYFGKLRSTSHPNVFRLKKQVFLSMNEDFCLDFSKKIIQAKIINQRMILNRYDDKEKLEQLKLCSQKARESKNIKELMGHEGQAARIYFSMITEFIKDDFKFKGRSRRPPKDPFNSLISLGYTMLINEITGMLEAKGLNPYIGYFHEDRERHTTLASDLIEEWRPILVDSVAIGMIQREELVIGDFWKDRDGGIFLTREALKKYLYKYEEKLKKETKYGKDPDKKISYRRLIGKQIDSLKEAVDNVDTSKYRPIRIRG